MLRFKRRLYKEDAREDRMTTEPADAQAVADLISDVFCECRSIVEADVGRLSGELFLKVDVEGRSLRSAADAVGLSTGDAKTALFLFRRQIASALVSSVLTVSASDEDQTRGEGRRSVGH